MVDAAPVARGLVVVGASAGGVEALSDMVRGLPADFPGCVLVVVHVPATGTSALPLILSRRGPLPARHARDGDVLQRGQILVAPPDHHLVVLDERITLTRGPQENGHRPAVDVLFRSAARAWGPRVAGVVLSGSLDDGAAGAVAIRSMGGRCLVQSDPLFDGMPGAAARADHPHASVRARDMPAELSSWLAELSAGEAPLPSALMEMEVDMAELDPHAMHISERPGEPAGFGCPDCAGGLYRIEEGDLTRFRCRVGHAWSPDSLLARQGVALESALWMALRSLEEKAALNLELGSRATQRGHHSSASRFAAGAAEATNAAELVRQLVATMGGDPWDQKPHDRPDGDMLAALEGDDVN
jgi:two-component system chemotaxis response regulator CheB